jgi:uncharacterized protein (TIGR00369 family)
MERRMNLSGLEFRLDTAMEMLPRLVAPWVLDLGLSLEAVDIEEPPDAVDWRPGVLMRMAFSERACRYGGIISGQAIMSLADAAMSFAVGAAMKKFLPIVTVDQTTHFLTTASSCDLIADARVVRHGRTMSFVQAQVSRATDRKSVAMVSSAFALT